MNKWLLTFVTLLVAGFVSSGAEAKKYKHRHISATYTTAAHPDCNVLWPCDGVVRNPRGERIVKAVGFGVSIPKYTRKRVSSLHPQRHAPRRAVPSYGAPSPSVTRTVQRAVERVADVATKMLPHPEGCTRRLFCGCGAAVELGLGPRRDLWLAAAWRKFPPSEPAPNRAAWRYGHVFVLKQHVEGDKWLVADYNSGGHRSRLHVRSIRGYNIVNPRA